jgi:hypothetical protein
VELADAVMLAKASAGVGEALSVQGRANADCDRNGTIDGNDLVQLLKYLAGSLTLEEFEGRA